VPLLVNRTSPPFLLCCVVDGFLPNGIELFNAFDGVLELPLVLFLSFGASFGESNPTFSFFIVLLMVFFLEALSFLVLFLVFLSLH
jgi:hypothetical protein